jgi:hypothetical protein
MNSNLAVTWRGPIFAAAFVAVALGADSPVGAQSLDAIVPTVEKCTHIGCNDATVLTGRLNGYGSLSNPWVGLFAGGSDTGTNPECLRLEVTKTSADVAMTVVAPDGTVYTDDDSGSCTRCPLVVIPNIGKSRVYTVVINHYAATPTEIGFDLQVGRYKPASNPNCANPTATAGRTLAERAKRAVRE